MGRHSWGRVWGIPREMLRPLRTKDIFDKVMGKEKINPSREKEQTSSLKD